MVDCLTIPELKLVILILSHIKVVKKATDGYNLDINNYTMR